MSTRLGVFMLMMLVSCAGPRVAPAPFGPGPLDTAEETRDRFDQLTPDLLKRHDAVGAAVAIVRDGEVAWTTGYGLTDRSTTRPVTEDTIFNVGSISKTVTAWGVMRLVEQGKLALDEPVVTYLTRWQFPPSRFDSHGVTVQRLLSHTAGLSMPSIPGFEVPTALPSIEATLSGDYRDSIYTRPGTPVELVDEPGTAFRYSGGGFVLLQLLVEEVTAEDFAVYMNREVLQPLEMTRSRFGWDEAFAAHVSTPYDRQGEPLSTYRFTGTAGAGLYTTATDLARFVAAGLQGGSGTAPGRGVLRRETVERMVEPVTLADGTTAPSGLGYFVDYGNAGMKVVTHGGSNIGWRAVHVSVPETSRGLVILVNSDNGAELTRDLICVWSWAELGVRPPDCR